MSKEGFADLMAENKVPLGTKGQEAIRSGRIDVLLTDMPAPVLLWLNEHFSGYLPEESMN